jgi:hypothetical protein
MVSLKKYIFSGFIFSIIIFFCSCQDKIFTGTVNCDECYSNKPDSVVLILHITLNNQFDTIPIVLYKGDIDKGKLIDTFDCFKDPVDDIWVKADTIYSVKAIYESSDRTVMVVDGTSKRQLKRVTGQCDTECWVIEGNELFLKLAF